MMGTKLGSDPNSLSRPQPLFFETGSLQEPTAHWFIEAGSQMSSRALHVSTSPALRSEITQLAFNEWWGSKYRRSCFHGILLEEPPSPTFQFLKLHLNHVAVGAQEKALVWRSEDNLWKKQVLLFFHVDQRTELKSSSGKATDELTHRATLPARFFFFFFLIEYQLPQAGWPRTPGSFLAPLPKC